MALLQKKAAGGRWQQSHPGNCATSSHHMASSSWLCSATGGRAVGTCARSLNAGVCGSLHPRMWQVVGKHCRAMAAMWCRLPVSIFPSSLPHRPATAPAAPVAARRRGTAFAGAACRCPVGSTRVDSHLPPCKVLLAIREDSERSLGGFRQHHPATVSRPPAREQGQEG